MRLYEAAGGEGWTNRQNWGVGEPCTDGWYGVYCCPIDFPHLINPTAPTDEQYCSRTPLGRRRASHDLESTTNVTIPDIRAGGSHFCSTGTSFGDDRDLAPCTVVQLRLDANNLTNTLLFDVGLAANNPFRNMTFNNLQAISIQNNSLTGGFPLWMTVLPALRSVRASGNAFPIIYDQEAAIADMCDRPSIVCEGLPGYGGSCSAFVDTAVLLQPWNVHCHDCPTAPEVESQWYSYVLAMLFAVAIYVAMVVLYAQGGHGITSVAACTSPHPTTLKGWVACSCILSFHVQTSILVCSVRPYWPTSVQRVIDCLSLEYTCFTYPECVVDDKPPLATHVTAKASADSFLATLLMIPPSIILALVFFRAAIKCKRRRDRTIAAEGAGPVAKLLGILGRDTWPPHWVEKAETAHAVVVENLPNVELVCSIFMVFLLAQTLRVARDSGSTLLFLLQPTLYILYGKDALNAQRNRKVKVQGELMSHAKLRVAYLTLPFKDRAATYQLIFFAQHVIVFYAASVANTGLHSEANRGGSQTWSMIFISTTLLISWAMHSVVEPWESAYQNSASSRLYTCHFITLAVSGLWNAYYEVPTHEAFFEFWLMFPVAIAPMLTLVYLLVGLRATRCANVLYDGVVAFNMPIWIRGMRYEFLPLPPGTIALPCLYAGSPTSDLISAALCKSMGETVDAEAIVTRRSAEFKLACNRLLEELSVNTAGSSLSSQVRRYGASTVSKAQRESLEEAQRKVLARFEEYRQRVMEIPKDSSKATALEDVSIDVMPEGDVEAPPPSLSKMKSGAPGSLLRRSSSKALMRAASLTHELAEVLEAEGEELEKEFSPEEMAVLRKLSARGKQLEEEAATAGDAESSPQPSCSFAHASSMSSLPTSSAEPTEPKPSGEPIKLTAKQDDTSAQNVSEGTDAASSPPPSPPPSPPEEPPAPSKQKSTHLGLADGEGSLSRGASRVGLAGGTVLARQASSRTSLADGTALDIERPSASGLSRGTVLDGKSPSSGLTEDLSHGDGKGLANGLSRGDSQGISSGLGHGDGRGLAGGLARGDSKGLAIDLGQGKSVGLAGDLADGSSKGITGDMALGVSKGLTDGLGSGASRGLASDLGSGASRGLAGDLARGDSKSLSDGLGNGARTGLAGDLARGDSQGLAKGLGGGHGVGLAGDLARGDGHGLADDLAKGNSVGLMKGLGQAKGKGVAAGTMLTDGYAQEALAAGTLLEDGEDSDDDGLTDGTILARIRHGVQTLATHEVVVKMQENYIVKEATAFVTSDLLNLEFPSKGAKRHGRQVSRERKRTLENKSGRRRGVGKPTLAREPPEPPELPKLKKGKVPTKEEEHRYLTSLIEWLVSPASDISQVRETVSAWPAKANRAEPGDEQLDRNMENVLHILERINYGTGGSAAIEDSATIPLIELGYQIVLCLHNHRDARTNSGRAAQLRQRWYLSLIDWNACAHKKASEGPPLLVMPNTYFRQWSGRSVRVKEPQFAGGIYARGSNALVNMVREGKAIVYDEAAMSVIALPAGVRVKILHRTIQEADGGFLSDIAWGDFGALLRNLKGEIAPLPFDEALADLRLDIGMSAGLLLEELGNLAEDIAAQAQRGEVGEAREFAKAFKREMAEVTRRITRNDGEQGASLGELAFSGDFPRIIRPTQRRMPEDRKQTLHDLGLSEEDDLAGGSEPPSSEPVSSSVLGSPGYSVHLCASDTRRLAPDASREIVVWLTIVDLQTYNPVNAASGGHLTPRNHPVEARESFLVPGDLACPKSADEVKTRLQAVEQMARRSSVGSSQASSADLSSPRARVETSLKNEDDETASRASSDARDAVEEAAVEAQHRRLRSQRLNRALPPEDRQGPSDQTDIEAGHPAPSPEDKLPEAASGSADAASLSTEP